MVIGIFTFTKLVFNLKIFIKFVPQTPEKTFKNSNNLMQIWAIRILNFMRNAINDTILGKTIFGSSTNRVGRKTF